MKTQLRQATIASLLIITSCPALSEDNTQFRTPSGNIHCMLIDGDEGSMADCEIVSIDKFTLPLKRQADCELDWGNRFELMTEQGPSMPCYGDTVRDPKSRVLGYGKSIQLGNITCTSKKTGLTCTDGSGHGFTLSRSSQTFF